MSTHYEQNKALYKERAKKWRENNRERYNEIANKRRKERLKIDPEFRDKVKIIKNNYRDKHYGEIKYHVAEKIAYWRKRYPAVKSDLTVEYLIDLYDKQEGLCYYTKQKMTLGERIGKATRNTFSLDRLTPIKGYVKGNVVWCCYFVNTMKGNLPEEEFYNYMLNILKIKSIKNE